MIGPATAHERELTLADLYEKFGPMPLHRIRQDPAPGRGSEDDVVEIHDREDRLYELVDGILVEKTISARESMLAMTIGRLLGNFVSARKLGIILGADGALRLMPGLVRIPDVSFVSWDRLPGREVPNEPIPDLTADLAVEVLSESNTEREMRRKLEDYFRAGTKLVWFVDPKAGTVEVFTAPDQSTVFHGGDTLDGGEVLPGFTLPIQELFGALGGEAR